MNPNQPIPPSAPAQRVRLLPLESARERLGLLSEEVLELVDCGRLIAFNLARQNSRRRLLRIWHGSIPVSDQHPLPARVLADALGTDPDRLEAERFFGSHELARLWCVGQEHLTRLAPEIGGARAGHQWKFSRRSCAAFLQKRRVA